MTAVFRKAFHDSWRGVLWLLIGLGLYMAMLMLFYPTMVEQSAELDEMLQSMPKQFIGLFAGDDIENFSVADPANFLQVRYTSFLLLIVGSMAFAQSFNAVINAERDGTLDVMMSFPIARRRYLLGRMVNTATMLILVLIVSFAVLTGFSVVIEEFSLTPGELARAIFASFFPVAAVASFGYMLSVLVPSSKGYAGAVAYAVLFGSYLVYGFASTVNVLEPLRPLMLFHYYNAADIVHSGVEISNVLVLSGATLVFAAIAWWYVDKKEFGV